MTSIKWVKFFATQAHTGQLYGPLPYTHHLQDVYDVLLQFKCEDEDILIAAWLHDTIEDTDVKYKTLVEMFGRRVADLVWAVTDEGDGPRKEVKAHTYQKIKNCTGATQLKLADRIANVKAGGELVGMYRKEQEEFRSLYVLGELEPMWCHLDGLLKYQEPKELGD